MLNSNTGRSSFIWALVGGASLVILVLGMRATASILSPLLLAVVLAITRKGLSYGLSMLITLLVLILAIVGLILLMGVSISDLVATLPQYADNMQGNTDALQSFLANRGIDVSNILSNDTFNPTKIIIVLSSSLSS